MATRTPEQDAARQRLLNTGKYELYTNPAGQTDIRLKKEYQKPVSTTPAAQAPAPVTQTSSVAPSITPSARPSATPATPTGQIGLRSTAEALGLNVGWSRETGPTINGVPVSTSGLNMIGEHWYGTPEQINKLLSPFQQQATVYQSPYSQQAQQALSDYQQWASQPYVSKLAPLIESMAFNVLSRTFNYDPANDEQFQRASKELTRNVMEAMNARGILNSTVTENQIQQGIADLLPQYQQLARQQFMDEGKQLMSQIDMLMGIDEMQYGRYMDEGTKLANALGIVMDMDEVQYKRWSDAYERRYREEQDRIAQEQAAIEVEREKVKDAWERVSQLGYVDNEAALILGVEPGTLSKEAREAREEQEFKLKQMEQEHKYRLSEINAQYEKERKLSEIRTETKEKTPEQLGTPEQVSNYYALRDIYFGGGFGTYAGKPLEAYNWLVSHREDNVKFVGEKLYNKLLAELTDTMKMQKTYGDSFTTDYTEDPVYDTEMSLAVQDPEGWLANYNENYQLYYDTFGYEGATKLAKAAQDEVNKKRSEAQTAKYQEYYMQAEVDSKKFKKYLEKNREQIINEVGIESYEKLKEKVQ